MVREDDEHVIHGPAPLEPLPKISLGKLIYDSLQSNPNKHEAFIDAVTGKSISFREILGLTCSLAESLKRNGYGKNTIMSVSSENSLQFFIPVIAGLYIGAAVAPINHNYTESESIHSLNICKPRLIFCSKAVYKKYVKLKQKLNYIERIIIIDSDGQFRGAETMSSFISNTLKTHLLIYEFAQAEFDPEKHIAFVMCSSGTTGLPKGVMQTHTNLMVRYMHTLDPRYVTKTENFLGILPFFHGYGLVTNFFAMVLGQKIVVIKRFEERLFLKAIQDHKITSLWLAPPLVVLLAKSPLVDKYDLSCVKEITSGAAPLSKETEEAVKRRLKVNQIRQGYGLTEATLAVMTVAIGDASRFGSSGKIMSYMSCKVRDPETGKSLGTHQVGELCFKGPMLMPGYYGNEEATRNSFTSDGWLLSGDLGYYDEDQYFYIVDRLKELIKYKGFQVAPAELEAVLLSHPKIKDVGVVGVPDEEAGELPLAFVVKSPGAKLTTKEVIDFVAKKVSSQKRLRGGVIFVPAIPKNPSGKILRRELRQMLSSYKSKL